MNGKIKNKLYKGFVCFVLVVFVFASSIYTLPFKKVKADTPTVAYTSYEITGVSQVTYIIYVLDAYQEMTVKNCLMYRYYNDENNFMNYTTTMIEFTYNPQYNYSDYKAYTYTRIFSQNDVLYTAEIRFETSTLRWDNVQLLRYTTLFFNVLLMQEKYNNGYDIGQIEGYRNGQADAYNSLEPGEEHYDEIYNNGKRQGFNEGESSQIDNNFMQGIFTNLDAFFSIHLAPYLTIGEILLAPLIIYFVWFLIKQFKGGD